MKIFLCTDPGNRGKDASEGRAIVIPAPRETVQPRETFTGQVMPGPCGFLSPSQPTAVLFPWEQLEETMSFW